MKRSWGVFRLLFSSFEARSRFLVLAFLILLLPLTPVRAADAGLSLATSPLPIALSAKPGTTATAELRVKNNNLTTERLKVSLLKFSAGGEDGSPQLSDRQPGDDYFDWVSFAPSVFDAPPGQWQTVKMTVTVPKSAAFGYYLAAVFSRASLQTPTGQGARAVLVGSTATLVLLDVTSPNTQRSLEAVSFVADRKFYEFLPATFSVKLHNTGNIHVAPVGTIFISRGKTQVAAIDVNTGRGNILPNSSRVYAAQWTDGFPVYVPKQVDGQPVMVNGKLVTTLKWDFTQVPKLRFGHYTAHVTMAYNDGKHDVPLEGAVDFWVVPWRVLGGALFIGLFVAIGLQSTVRNLWRRIFRKKR